MDLDERESQGHSQRPMKSVLFHTIELDKHRLKFKKRSDHKAERNPIEIHFNFRKKLTCNA